MRQEAKDIEFRFGKHKGKTIDEVYQEDAGYLEWCLDNFDDKNFMKLKIKEYMGAKDA